MIFHSKIREVNSSKKTFLPLIEELLDLESEGINIEVECKSDETCLNTLFLQGITASYSCRICKINKKNFLKYLFEESKFIK